MLTYSALTDNELILLLRDNDDMAFKEIFDRYHSLLYQFACKKTKDSDEAKDILQEVFVHLWNKRANFEITTSLSSYLYRSVLNKILNIIKHKIVHEGYVQSLHQWINETHHGSDYLIREKDIEKLIAKEITALPPKMREVFELRKKEFLSNRQIAEKLGLSEQTVETHMKRALRVLRKRLSLFIYFAYLLY